MSDVFDVASFESTMAAIDKDSELPVAVAWQKPTMLTVLYTPRGEDKQTPHEQDEVYIVASGTATLEVNEEQRDLSTGDAAFVAAQAEHRFLNISDDFAAWAVFPLQSS